MYAEDDFLPISALQHLEFCARQCALIHLENLWAENELTAQGRLMHVRVHEQHSESRPGVCITRSLRLHSFRLGLVGQADIVEFHRLGESETNGFRLEGRKGLWRAIPVEYKRGRPKSGKCDMVQLCAQAMCLEEMLDATILNGALYYGKLRRRTKVDFDENLRSATEKLAAKLHELIRNRITPLAKYGKKCDKCSLFHQCMPKVTGVRKNIDKYLAGAEHGDEGEW